MGSLGSNSCDYEKLRNARISENQARLASLGVEKSIAELRTAISSRKPATPSPRKKYCRVMYDYTNLRRSNRLIKLQEVLECSPLRRSNRLKGKYGDPISSPEGKDSGSKPTRRRLLSSGGAEEGKRATNAPYLMVDVSKMKLSSDDVARRCNSKERGSVYNPVFDWSSIGVKSSQMHPDVSVPEIRSQIHQGQSQWSNSAVLRYDQERFESNLGLQWVKHADLGEISNSSATLGKSNEKIDEIQAFRVTKGQHFKIPLSYAEVLKNSPSNDKIGVIDGADEINVIRLTSKGKHRLKYHKPYFNPVDGSAVVRCPREVIEEGIELWKDTIAGHFVGAYVHFYTVRDQIKDIWDIKGPLTISRKDSVFFFTFGDSKERDKVLEGGPWHVGDKYLKVQKWSPFTSIEDDKIERTPIWVRLMNLPKHCYTHNALGWIHY
ncbi:hypothetical protein GIB67_020915 [Kingdonia uniflora]|uniref:DUF4283 domain-containing protein n=1 Tax=Kingdonia uniflora TaxID=39325 RepID=A0A7J7M7L8_9MAGN|nr:hypothetical protein GIB67_020915 [Kingdonia uniflora]